jgi:hypothetical protein
MCTVKFERMGSSASVGKLKPSKNQLRMLRESMDACEVKNGTEWVDAMRKALEEALGNKDEDPEVRKKHNEEFLYACGAYRPKVGAKANLLDAHNLWSKGVVDTDYTDEDTWTALHHAAGEGELKITEFLILECSALLDPVDEYGCTPLWIAACNDRRDVVKFLLLSGASTEISGKPEGEPDQKPALAARRNRHPGLGDLIDAEAMLRAADDSRQLKQMAKEMTMEEFNDSMRGTLKQVAAM